MKAEVRGFLEKAERMLRAAEILHRENDPESAIGRAYYAMLHTAQALFRVNSYDKTTSHSTFPPLYPPSSLLQR